MYLENSYQPKIDVNSEYNEITLKTNTGNITIPTEGKIYRDFHPITDHEGKNFYSYYRYKKDGEPYDTYIGKSTIDYTLPREGTHSEGTRRKHRRGDYIKQMFSYGRVRRGGTRKSRRKSCKN